MREAPAAGEKVELEERRPYADAGPEAAEGSGRAWAGPYRAQSGKGADARRPRSGETAARLDEAAADAAMTSRWSRPHRAARRHTPGPIWQGKVEEIARPTKSPT